MTGLRDLVGRYTLPDGAEARLEALVAGLADPLAPTTAHARAEAIDVHLADSLVGLELDAVRDATTIADLGAGAGFPGLALAVALPRTRVTLVESAARKAAFIAALAERADIANAAVAAVRAEDWRAGAGANDVVAVRALAELPVVLEYAAPLLRVRGSLVAWRGRRDRGEEARAATAADALGLEPTDVRSVRPFRGAEHRHLHSYVKVTATPERFPRRAGMARKRPLGGPRREG